MSSFHIGLFDHDIMEDSFLHILREAGKGGIIVMSGKMWYQNAAEHDDAPDSAATVCRCFSDMAGVRQGETVLHKGTESSIIRTGKTVKRDI